MRVVQQPQKEAWVMGDGHSHSVSSWRRQGEGYRRQGDSHQHSGHMVMAKWKREFQELKAKALWLE